MHWELNKLILQIIIPYTCIGIIYQIDFKLMEKSFKGLARENKKLILELKERTR